MAKLPWYLKVMGLKPDLKSKTMMITVRIDKLWISMQKYIKRHRN